jgi:membrane fusion protein (multidrug efflux system)
MAITTNRPAETSAEATSTPASPAAALDKERPAAVGHAQSTTSSPGATDQLPSPPTHPLRKWLLLVLAVFGLAVAVYFGVPWVVTMLTTVSTDDAYVNGHVTFVAPRVAGQVITVLVDDNYRVKKGDLLVQLDKEPFQVQVDLKKAAVQVAEGDLAAAEAQARGLEALARAQRWKMQTASEQVNNQVALLAARAAALKTKEATLQRAKADYDRGRNLLQTGGISREDFDQRQQAFGVADASVNQAREDVFQIRASLGLSPQPDKGKELTEVPQDLDQTFSAVRSALADLLQSMAQLGQPLGSTNLTPNQAIAEFTRLDKEGNIDRILRGLIPKVPAVLQAKAKLAQARHDLEQAELNLRYCDVVSEIDGVVTRRNVNPGNNVTVGQSLMAVRSLTEIWIDANFKETQLSDLRIGHRVKVEVDMYGSRKEFEGRITGFTFGTGQTLALLPPQNATGNFVKIVQRLPVRIELTDYDPDQAALFVGLSVTPYVYYREPPTGPNAGKFLQRLTSLPQGPTEPKP